MKQLEKKPSYTDTDKMPFGKHKNKPLSDVPVDYLHWIYHNIDCGNNISLQHYIENNIDALKMENTDLLWIIKK